MNKLEKLVRRFFIEIVIAGAILFLIYIFRNSDYIALSLMLVYMAIIMIIQGVRKLT